MVIVGDKCSITTTVGSLLFSVFFFYGLHRSHSLFINILDVGIISYWRQDLLHKFDRTVCYI